MKKLSFKNIFEQVAGQYGINAILLFGSQVNNESNPLSDVVFLQETPLSLQYRAVSEGELIFVADTDAYADYIEYVMKYYFDFLPVEQEFYRALIS